MRKYTVTEYKDNLTDEHALVLLKRISNNWLPDYNFDGTENDFDNYCLHQAIYRAMDALRERSEGK